MRTQDFYYELPPELIAQTPAPERDASRLLVFDRKTRARTHTSFRAVTQYFHPGDLLVMNNSKVIPARLRAHKPGTGGAVEILLIEELARNDWWVMLKPGKRVRPGTRLTLLTRSGAESGITAEMQEKSPEGQYRLQFAGTSDIQVSALEIGEIPLPPYIRRSDGTTHEDMNRYQTVYAGPAGSVAAPTAGLHFTPSLLDHLRTAGILTVEITLHVGLGTFTPVKTGQVEQHRMHSERYEVTPAAAELVNRTKSAGRRVIAVGTTSLRVLESAAGPDGRLAAGSGKTDIFIYPPYHFKIVDALLTNFHLPESTLLMLASAFAAPGAESGRELILQSYEEAVRERYRFFSYGDAMLIL